MIKKQLCKYLVILPLFFSVLAFAVDLPKNYETVVKKLIVFNENNFTVFYGGPISKGNGGIQWIMPAFFKDNDDAVRAVYEMAFINCSLDDAADAEIVFVKVSDVDIKFRNESTKAYAEFTSLLQGQGQNNKYIVVRFSDMSNVCYPDIFFDQENSRILDKDKETIVNFLHKQFSTKNSSRELFMQTSASDVDFANDDEVSYKPCKITVRLKGKLETFFVTKKVRKNDPWKVYYVISKQAAVTDFSTIDERIPLRIDSGCVSGQIYDDESCDCVDQLHAGLEFLVQDESEYGLVIHIPAQDGRGFGTAPKAETEIYKYGGRGRVHETEQLDTVAAAELLYGTKKIDCRTYDGVAEVLKSMNIKKILCFTDNKRKIGALEKYGFDVKRTETKTNKSSCLDHIKAKKNTETYYGE